MNIWNWCMYNFHLLNTRASYAHHLTCKTEFSINNKMSNSGVRSDCSPSEITAPTDCWWTVNRTFNQFSTPPVHATSFSSTICSSSRECIATILSYSFSENFSCTYKRYYNRITYIKIQYKTYYINNKYFCHTCQNCYFVIILSY